jgi:dimethylglycine dehydrogenase
VSTDHSKRLVHVGSAALNAMRMEKAYRSGHEITNEVTLVEADLMRFSRDSGFQGAGISTAPAKRWVLAYLQLDEPGENEPQADPLGSETVWHDGVACGHISSGGYGYGIGHYLAFAYLQTAIATPGTEVEIHIMGTPRRAVVMKDALRDPENLLPRMDG